MGREWQLGHAERMQQNKVKRIARNKAMVDELKDGKHCSDCRNCFPAVCMDYDHVRGEKKADVVDLVHGAYSCKVILEEIDKCDLVCANCHRIRTWKSGRETPWQEKLRVYDRSAWISTPIQT